MIAAGAARRTANEKGPARSGALILPGVHIGSRAVIGAGRVVTRHVAEGVFAAGNLCRVIRAIEE